MKKPLLSTAFILSIASTSVVFAHHPAADRVDPEIYAMIDENVSDTPHAEMTFDDMGSDMEAAASAAEARGEMEASADIEERGAMSEREDIDSDDRGNASELASESREAAEAAAEAADIDTMEMFDNVASMLAE